MGNRWGWYILWVGAGGTPLPEIFLAKNVIFRNFTNIRNHGTEKIWGVGTPSLGRHPPLKFFGVVN